jgi:hypothetical protein
MELHSWQGQAFQHSQEAWKLEGDGKEIIINNKQQWPEQGQDL